MNSPTTEASTGDQRQTPFSIIVPAHEHANPQGAFTHGLALAVACRGEIEVVDVQPEGRDTVRLGVRETLESWGILPPGSKRDDVAKAGIRVKKISADGKGEKAIGKRLQKRGHDLMVIGTETRDGIAGLFGQDLAAHLAQTYGQTTLYVPLEARPLVDQKSGFLSLRKVLVPVAEEPRPEPCLVFIDRLARMMSVSPPQVIAVHVGKEFPSMDDPLDGRLLWEKRVIGQDGESVQQAVARVAREEEVDLIALSTNGRDTISQKIMGSSTELVVRVAPCPVLAVAVE